MTDLSYTSKLSTLSPAPPPAVSAWGRQNSIIQNSESNENLEIKEHKSGSDLPIPVSSAIDTETSNISSPPISPVVSPIDQNLSSSHPHHLSSKAKQTGKEKWVHLDANIKVVPQEQDKITTTGSGTSNNNHNHNTHHTDSNGTNITNVKKKKPKVKSVSKDKASISKSNKEDNESGSGIESSIRDIAKAAEGTLSEAGNTSDNNMKSESSHNSSVSPSPDSFGLSIDESSKPSRKNVHKSRTNSSGNVNRSNNSNNSSHRNSFNRRQSHSNYSPQIPINTTSPNPQQMSPPFQQQSAPPVPQQYPYYVNYSPYKYYAPQGPQQFGGYGVLQPKRKTANTTSSSGNNSDVFSNSDDSESTQGPLLSSPPPQLQTNIFAPHQFIQPQQQSPLVMMGSPPGTPIPVSPSQYPESPQNMQPPQPPLPPHLVPLQQQGYIDPTLYYHPQAGGGGGGGVTVAVSQPPATSSSSNLSYSQPQVPLYIPQPMPQGMPPMQQPYMGPGSQYMTGSTNSKASFSGTIQPMYYSNNRSYSLVDDRLDRLIMQIEYYFSQANLIKDIYLRQHMNSEGFVTIQFIASFKRVSSIINGDNHLINQAIKSIEFLELQGTKKVRIKQGWEKWVLPKDQRSIKD